MEKSCTSKDSITSNNTDNIVISDEKSDVYISTNNNINDNIEDEIKVENIVEDETSDPSINNLISIKDASGTTCLRLLGNSSTVTESRRVLLKVEKNKFEYPLLKTSNLFTKLNFPIVESIQVTQTPRTETYNIPVNCNSKTGNVTVDFTDVSLKLFVSYSVELYNVIPGSIISDECIDIRNIDVYSFEKDTFFATPFYICFTKKVPQFAPNDFLVTLTTSTPVVSPVCEFSDYYLYEVDVDIEVALSPIVIVDPSDTISIAALNTQLGNIDLSNNKFTRGELETITELDLSNNPNLDFTIFLYLVNLKKLNISNVAYDNYKLTYLENLLNLEILIAKNNYFTDYISIGKILSLKELYLDNDIITTFAIKLNNSNNN
ncbi:MAG: hypothetical protein ACRCXA_00535, partial [Peptostreptococcaceae bacterium]